MRIHIDSQYSPQFIKLITSLHALQYNSPYEIVCGQWKDEYQPNDTVVFLWDTNKRGLSPQITRYYKDGYKVFTFKKPFGSPMDPFNVSLLMLSQWKRMLDFIEKEEKPFLFTISDSKIVLKKIS